MIINIYNALKLKRSSIIFNSMICFHKYYIYNLYSNKAILNNSLLEYIAVACFFSGTKSSDFKIRVDDILNYSYKKTEGTISAPSVFNEKQYCFVRV